MKKLLTTLAVLLALSPFSAQAVNVTVPASTGLGTTLYGKANGNYAILSVGANGDCMKLALGIPSWGSCGAGGGGGTDGNWTFFNTSGIRLATTSNQVLIGASATTSLAALEVIAQSTAKGSLLATGSTTLQNFTATNGTTTNATTTKIFSTTASSTNLFSLNATTTSLGITGIASSLLKTTASGGVIAAVSGTDYSNFGASVGPTELQATDFGDWTCNGTTCTLDQTYLTGNQTITLSGDISGSGATSIATTLATVNTNTGSFGSSTAIPNFTVNGKGLITAAGTNAVVAPAGTLTGTTLAANVVTSSLTSVGTLTNLTVTNPITGSITGNAGTATALAANGTNCSAGNYPLGVDASGNAENCTTAGSGSWATSSQDYYVSQFRDWSLQGSPLYLAPTTSRAVLINNGTSTITNLTSVNSTSTNATTTHLYVSGRLSTDIFSAITSAGMLSESANGTDVSIFGVGNTANSLFYGGVNIDGATRLATSLNGILKATSGAVTAASNGTDYTLISATTCSGTDKVSAISASGAVTCSADQSGGGGSGGGSWSTTTSTVSGQLINYPNNGTDIVTIGATATTSAEFYFDPNLPFAKIGSALLVTGSTTLQNFTGVKATTTNSTTTTGYHSTLGLNSEYFTDLTGTGLSNTAGVLTNSGVTSIVAGQNIAISGATGAVTINSVAPTTTLNYYNSLFRNWSVNSAGALQPTTTRPIIIQGQSGNIGLGTTTPFGFVSVGNHNGGTEPIFVVASSSTAVATSTWLQVNQFGRTIIGSTTPATLNGQLQVTGRINSYVEGNVQNLSSGGSASSDWVATNDIGNDSKYFVDLGINSSTYNDGAFTITGPNDSYLYSSDASLVIGTASTTNTNAVIKFHTGGTLSANERARITATGNFGIATDTPSQKLSVSGNIYASGGATTTGLASLNLVSCDTIDTDSQGNLKCGSDATGGGGGLSFGQAWELYGSGTYLAPTTTKGFIVTASSTIGNGTQAGGLTIYGGATTTGNLKIGTSASTILFDGLTGSATTSHATSTNLYVSNQFRLGTESGCASFTSGLLTGTGSACGSGGGSTFGQAWELYGSGTYLAPTTTKGFIVNASSTISVLTVTNGTTTNATSTNFFSTTASSTNLFTSIFTMPNNVNPTVSTLGITAINTTSASSSIRFHDGSAERAIYPTYDRSFNFASSSLAYDGAFGASGTTTKLLANPYRPTTLVSFYCKTLSAGTAHVAFGTGTATTTDANCSTSGVEVNPTSNNSWTMRQNMFVEIGRTTGSPNDIIITATFRSDAD